MEEQHDLVKYVEYHLFNDAHCMWYGMGCSYPNASDRSDVYSSLEYKLSNFSSEDIEKDYLKQKENYDKRSSELDKAVSWLLNYPIDYDRSYHWAKDLFEKYTDILGELNYKEAPKKPNQVAIVLNDDKETYSVCRYREAKRTRPDGEVDVYFEIDDKEPLKDDCCNCDFAEHWIEVNDYELVILPEKFDRSKDIKGE